MLPPHCGQVIHGQKFQSPSRTLPGHHSWGCSPLPKRETWSLICTHACIVQYIDSCSCNNMWAVFKHQLANIRKRYIWFSPLLKKHSPKDQAIYKWPQRKYNLLTSQWRIQRSLPLNNSHVQMCKVQVGTVAPSFWRKLQTSSCRFSG